MKMNTRETGVRNWTPVSYRQGKKRAERKEREVMAKGPNGVVVTCRNTSRFRRYVNSSFRKPNLKVRNALSDRVVPCCGRKVCRRRLKKSRTRQKESVYEDISSESLYSDHELDILIAATRKRMKNVIHERVTPKLCTLTPITPLKDYSKLDICTNSACLLTENYKTAVKNDESPVRQEREGKTNAPKSKSQTRQISPDLDLDDISMDSLDTVVLEKVDFNLEMTDRYSPSDTPFSFCSIKIEPNNNYYNSPVDENNSFNVKNEPYDFKDDYVYNSASLKLKQEI